MRVNGPDQALNNNTCTDYLFERYRLICQVDLMSLSLWAPCKRPPCSFAPARLVADLLIAAANGRRKKVLVTGASFCFEVLNIA